MSLAWDLMYRNAGGGRAGGGKEEGRIIPVLYSCNLLLRPHIREFKRDDTLIINQFVEAVEYG